MGDGGEKDYDEMDELTDQGAAGCRMLFGVTEAACNSLAERHRAVNDEEAARRVSMLFDDLADIYKDLSKGIRRFNLGTEDAIKSALWEWRFNFDFHWGEHLFMALTTLHEIRYQQFDE
jgi:hypothetical protein